MTSTLENMVTTLANATVVVLSGGLSHEREVSLRSGRRVTTALRETGLSVIETDLSSNFLALLQQLNNPVVFPVLHGGFGEDGSLRRVLELAKIPFVGSKATASRLAYDKANAHVLLRNAGYYVPKQIVLPFDMFAELGAQTLMSLISEEFGFPVMVKPNKGGSALGVTKVEDSVDLPAALRGAFAYGPDVIFEEYIEGTEVAVSVVDVDGKTIALSPVAIEPRSGFYDYTARYTAGECRFICPASFDLNTLNACTDLTLAAHKLLGLRHLSRTDMIVNSDGKPYFLETSVAPGMTETSTLPIAADNCDFSFTKLCVSWVAAALAEGGDWDAYKH